MIASNTPAAVGPAALRSCRPAGDQAGAPASRRKEGAEARTRRASPGARRARASWSPESARSSALLRGLMTRPASTFPSPWGGALPKFVKVMPSDYKRVLEAQAAEASEAAAASA